MSENQPEHREDENDFELDLDAHEMGFLRDERDELGELWPENADHEEYAKALVIGKTELNARLLQSLEKEVEDLEASSMTNEEEVIRSYDGLERALQGFKQSLVKSCGVKTFSSLLRLRAEKNMQPQIAKVADMIDLIHGLGERIVIDRKEKIEFIRFKKEQQQKRVA